MKVHFDLTVLQCTDMLPLFCMNVRTNVKFASFATVPHSYFAIDWYAISCQFPYRLIFWIFLDAFLFHCHFFRE